MFEKLLSIFKKEEKTMNVFTSEALKRGIEPQKPIDEMTPEEIQDFLAKIDPDTMGFLGKEGADEDEN